MNSLSDLVLSPGLLEFDAWIGPKPFRLWIKGHGGEAAEVTPHADSALALGLIPAMREGGTLRVEGDISPKVLRTQREFQAIQEAWSHDSPWSDEPLREVTVEAGERPVPTPKNNGRVACFFSGGVDSWASILADPEITDLIFVKGADILPTLSPRHVGLGEKTEANLREVAAELGKQLHVVELNIREFSDPLVNWIHVFNSVLCGVALYFEPLFDRVLIPTDTNHRNQQPVGASRLVDMLWSSEALEILDHGSRLTRFERTRLLARSPLAQRTLRVCYMNYDQTYNCGRCPKCSAAMIALEALGVREKFTTFPAEFDFSALEDYTPMAQVLMVFWEDLLHGVEECGREDLAEVVRPILERGARKLADPALVSAQEEAAAARAEAAAVREEAAAAQAKVREVLGSTSWQATEPLRRAGIAARGARSRLRSRGYLDKNKGVEQTAPLAERVVAANLTYLDRPKIQLLESCVDDVQGRAVAGDFLEMGIALGGSGILIANLMGPGRRYHGYDVFGMIPPPSAEDPPPVHERYRTIAEGRSEGIGGDTYYGYIDDLYDRVVASFAAFGQPVDGERVQLHRGLFEETLHPESEVAFAHVDCDWYEPVELCIERVWPHLAGGGMMVFDDYTEYGGCTKAVDEFVAANEDAILRMREPSAVLVKA